MQKALKRDSTGAMPTLHKVSSTSYCGRFLVRLEEYTENAGNHITLDEEFGLRLLSDGVLKQRLQH